MFHCTSQRFRCCSFSQEVTRLNFLDQVSFPSNYKSYVDQTWKDDTSKDAHYQACSWCCIWAFSRWVTRLKFLEQVRYQETNLKANLNQSCMDDTSKGERIQYRQVIPKLLQALSDQHFILNAVGSTPLHY